MPIFDATTKTATKIWASPDGKRTIYDLALESDGKVINAKTYSDSIATVGWSGQVESYEKAGRQGPEIFVKQAPKEGGWTGGTGGGRSKPQGDNFTMYLSYAKDLVVALQMTSGYDDKALAQLIKATIGAGYELYENRPDAPKPDDVIKTDDLENLFGEEPWQN